MPDDLIKREISFRQDPDDIRCYGPDMAHDLTVLACMAAGAATIIVNSSDPELARQRFLDDLDREIAAG
jgi:hypothetical protein